MIDRPRLRPACDRGWWPILVMVAFVGCTDEQRGAYEVGEPSPASLERALFVDATEQTGLDFRHENGMSGELYFSEVVGAGAALFDYDRDGDLDVYLVEGGALGEASTPSGSSRDRLFRNDLETPGGLPRFVEVTEESGIRAAAYGMGVATGDVDNDGWVDLYLTSFGANEMWRNNGDGTFTEITAMSGTGEKRWSVSSSFLDFDGDGWLDLYVGNYVDFSLANHKRCYSDTGARDYCGPLSFRGESDRLFRNRGDGSFEDASGLLRRDGEPGGALGVVSGDFNGDGRLDVYVANDQTPNHLWINEGGASFRDEAALAGAGVNSAGMPEASMGVEAADFDGDGDEDLFMAHLRRESNTLYVNDGGGLFRDQSTAVGLALPSLPFTGFGTAALDFDGDGWIDLMVVNGAVRVLEELAAVGDPHPLHQTNQLYRNEAGHFVDVTSEAGPAFDVSEVSRGAAVGDVDNDGDPDVVLTNNGGPARLLLNQHDPGGSFVGLAPLNRAGAVALGARLTISTADRVHERRSRSGGGYASARDPRVLVGLGSDSEKVDVVVAWPTGGRERWSGLEAGVYHDLRQGQGEPGGSSP